MIDYTGKIGVCRAKYSVSELVGGTDQSALLQRISLLCLHDLLGLGSRRKFGGTQQTELVDLRTKLV